MSTPQPPTRADYEAAAPYYRAALADGVERFFEPRRDTCPWCGSSDLVERVRATDMVQRKPGQFVLDTCRSCGHVFQNPRLTIEGLDFYYRDFYDGLGQHNLEGTFEAGMRWNVARAEMVKAELARSGATAARWLDVGTGHGHFGKHARSVLPDTRIEGLDMGSGVLVGEERGWLARAHQGMFPELAASLAGQFDVVSMHHYLEHTREPRAELDAAAEVLAPGGLLLVEVPDPEYRLAKLFRGLWTPLLQPQHLQLIPKDNLVQALSERGLEPVAIARGAAHMAVDVAGVVVYWFRMAGPDPSAPWLLQGDEVPRAAPSTTRRRAKKLVAIPALVAAGLVDRALTALARRMDSGNAYRVLARKARA